MCIVDRCFVSCSISIAVASYVVCVLFFFKQKTAYEMRISDWSSDVCSSDLIDIGSGMGFSLQVAKARGWTASGIEPNQALVLSAKERGIDEIGRASCRERVCQYV